MDSIIIVQYLHIAIDEHHPYFTLIRQCKQLLARDWVVRICHVYREGNRVAYWTVDYTFKSKYEWSQACAPSFNLEFIIK